MESDSPTAEQLAEAAAITAEMALDEEFASEALPVAGDSAQQEGRSDSSTRSRSVS